MSRKDEYVNLLQELEYTPKELDQTLEKAQNKLKRKKVNHFIMTPIVTFVTSFILFTILINVYSPFAYACGRIPYLGELAKVVALSPSLSAAVENEYVQPIDLKQTKEEITARVEYVIVDQKQLNIFYSLESKRYKEMRTRTQIKGPKGESLEGYIISSSEYGAQDRELRKVTIDFVEEGMPSSMEVDIGVYDVGASMYEEVEVKESMLLKDEEIGSSVGEEEHLITTFTFLLEFNPYDTAKGEILEVNDTFEIDGQHLTLTAVEIYPTQSRITFEDDKNNTAWLKSLEGYIENENGKRYEKLSGGISATGSSDSPMMVTHTLESPFFSESKELTLYITQVTWLDKDMETISVDLKNKTAAALPQSVVFEEANPIGSSWELVFTAKQTKTGGQYQLFNTSYYDEEGNEYSYNSWMSTDIGDTTEGGNEQEVDGGTEKEKRFKATFVLREYPYDLVYLSPIYSRRVDIQNPIKIPIKE